MRNDSEFVLKDPGGDGGGTFDQLPTDDELTALALAADPEAPLGDDAIPLSLHLAQFAGSLPQWYMPPAMARQGKWWRTPVVGAIVAAFLIIEGLGLCNTYGVLSFA